MKQVQHPRKYKSGKITIVNRGMRHKIGYSSYGNWSSLQEIKEIEVKDRGNDWFNDSKYNLNKYVAIWVTYDPKIALRYNHSAGLWDWALDKKFTPDELLKDEWVQYKKELRNPTKYVRSVDLTGATMVHTDGDGGYLYVKLKPKTYTRQL